MRPLSSDDDLPEPRIRGKSRGELSDLRRRIALTYRHHGPRSVLLRALTFPLRFTPLRPYLRFGFDPSRARMDAMRWYRDRGRPVTIVIPSYRDAAQVRKLVSSIRRTTERSKVRIVVADDSSGAEHVAALKRISGIELVEGAENRGFAANVNRGLLAAGDAADVVILNSDVVARRGWLASLQWAAVHDERAGIVGAKLLYPDGRIQSAGTVRNPTEPLWFDHRYRGRPANWGPANVPQPVLAVTGACMYVTRSALRQIGQFDESFPMGYEDVDFCLRAWQAGLRVSYAPAAALQHEESVTRGRAFGERERRSQQRFWERWRQFFDGRSVRAADGTLRIIYVTQDTGVGGGHRVVFEQLNELRARGHDAELWCLDGPPSWFDLQVPLRTFSDYDQLMDALAPLEAIKVATWWRTAAPVWEASVARGVPVYLVQDIETSYYPDDEQRRDEVLASYRYEFNYVTTSSWNARQLDRLGLGAALIPPGVDLSTFFPHRDVVRRPDVILAVGRSNPLKNFALTLSAWHSLRGPRPDLWLFGVEPEVAGEEPGIRYVMAPSDAQISELLAEATMFVQTSTHEGFCLPVLEAMAAGCPVICTDAHGNRDFCEDEVNCLMVAPTGAAVASAITRLLGDPALRERLSGAGIDTAASYGWPGRIDPLEDFFNALGEPRHARPSSESERTAPRGSR